MTSTRRGLETQMAMDVIPVVYDHLNALPQVDTKPQIDLFLHSNGGDGTVPWRLVSLIREYASTFNVLVPNNAYSAATLTALGADEVVMHPMGVLGPTDPTITTPLNPVNPLQQDELVGISVEDVASYIALVREDVGIRHEDELVQAFNTLTEKVHPLVLGNVKRSTSQSRMMGRKLLELRNNALAPHEVDEIVEKLTSQLFYHGHPISRTEAQSELGLSFVRDATPDEENAMWSLYEEYEQEMKLRLPFEPWYEAVTKTPVAPPPPNPPGTPPALAQQTIRIDTAKTVYVESDLRCDVYSAVYDVLVTRDQHGNIMGQPMLDTHGWSTE